MRMTAISSQENCFAAIWRKKKVDSYYLEPQICSSQLFGVRKKRMTVISSQKNCFAAICIEKKVVHKTLEHEKRR